MTRIGSVLRSLFALGLALALVACWGGTTKEIQKAQDLLRKDTPAKAVPILHKVLEREPDNAEANYLLGTALLGTGQVSKALWPLRKAAESNSKVASQAGVVLATVLLQTDDQDAALKAVNQVLDKNPDLMPALAVRVNIQLQRDDPEAALADAERMLQIDPSNYAGWITRASALEKLKRYKEAGEAAKKAYAAAVKSAPSQAPIACEAIAEYLDQYALDRPAATAQAQKCVDLYPGEYRSLHLLVWLDDAQGKSEEGTRQLLAGLQANPKDSRTVDDVVERLTGMKKYDELDRVLEAAAKTSDNPKTWQVLAEQRRNRKKYDAALEAIAQGLVHAKSLDRDELQFLRAEILVDKGEPEKGIAVASKLRNPAYGMFLHGWVLAHDGHKEQALRTIEKGLDSWPNNVAARLMAAQLCEDLGKWDQAIDHYREASRAAKKRTDAALHAAELLDKMGRYREASTLLAFHAKYRPITPRFYAVAGDVALHLGFPKDAIKYYRHADPLASVVGQAAAEKKVNGPAAALKVLDSKKIPASVRSQPAFLGAYAQDAQQAGQLPRALAAVDAALQGSHPKRASALLALRGQILLAQGKKQEAAAAFDEAVKRDPKNGAAIAGQGRVLEISGKRAQAIERYDAAMAAARPDFDAGYRAGRLSFDAGDKKGAERRWRDVIQKDPAAAAASNDLAWLLAEEGRDLNLALRLAGKAVRLREDDPAVWDTLGTVLIRRGKDAEAVKPLRKSLELRPGAPDVEYRLAVALSKSGKPKEAQDVLQKALKSDGLSHKAEARALAAKLASAGSAR